MRAERIVFVVDDDASMLRAVGRTLKEHGFQAVLFNSAKELRLHDDFRQAFCLVLDIDLGADSGIALHQELRTAGITLPVIYISGKQTSQIRAAGPASGCIAHLTKPFSAKSLIEAIQEAWTSQT